MPSIGSFWGNSDKYSLQLTEPAWTRENGGPERIHDVLRPPASHKKGSVHCLLEHNLEDSVTSLESCGYGWPLEWRLVFPWQSPHCFKLSECFLWHFICSADVKIWNYFIFSVCWVAVSFFFVVVVPLLEIFHPQRIPDSDIIHLMSGTLKSHELPYVLSLSTFGIFRMLLQLKSILSFACFLSVPYHTS